MISSSIPLIFIVLLIATESAVHAQTYTVNLGGYSGSAVYSPQTYTITGSFGSLSQGSSTFTSVPSVPTSFSITFYSSFYNNTCTLSGTVGSRSICGGSGSFNTTNGSCGGGGNSAGISLGASANLSISSIDPSDTYCASNKITITGSPGFGNYTWYYRTGASGAWIPFVNNTLSTYNFGIQDVFGASYTSHFNEPTYFAYGITGCGVGPVLSNAYSFAPDQVTITSASALTVLEPRCLNGSEGSISVPSLASYSRSQLPGETFFIEVHTAEATGPATLVPNPNALSAGRYYVLARSNQGGCGAVTFTTVDVGAGPRSPVTVIATLTSPITCHGLSDAKITVTASGGGGTPYEYKLDGGSFSTTSVLDAGAGPHIITVQDGCMTPATKGVGTTNINVADVTAVTADGTPSWCNSGTTGTITAIGAGGAEGWKYSLNEATYQSDPLFTGLDTGTPYSIKVQDQNGCESAAAFITIPKTLTASYQKIDPHCTIDKGSITISNVMGGTGSYHYRLNGGALGPDFQFPNLSSGTYSAGVEDDQGCPVNFSNIVINPFTPISVTGTTTNVTCEGGTNGTITVSTMNAGTGVLYSLNGGTDYQTANVFTNKPIGSAYIVTITNDDGCITQSNPITINQDPTLSATYVQSANILCNGNATAALNLTPSGGPVTGVYTFDWSSAQTSHFSTQEDVAGLPASIYSVTIGKGICSKTISNIVVLEPALLTSGIIKTDQSCHPVHGIPLSTNGSIDLSVSGGTSPFTYAWSNAATTQDLSNISSGTYNVTVTDANGCTTQNSATLIQPVAVTSSIASFTDVTCHGLNNGSITVSASGGSGVFNYSLNAAPAQSPSVFSSLQPDNYVIITKDQNGCSSQTNQLIKEPDELIVITHDIVNTTCGNTNGAAATTVSGGIASYTYSWENIFHQVISTNPNLTSMGGGAYTVTVKDINLCTATATALITSSDGPQIQYNSVTPTTCFNTNDGKASISIAGGAAPYAVDWDNGETGNTPIALFPGNNVIMVTDDHQCVVVDLVNVPHPTAIAIDTQTITPPTCPGSTDAAISLTATGGVAGYTFAWTAGNTSSSITGIPAGEYGVTITDSNQCKLVSSIKINAVTELKIKLSSSQQPTCFGGSDGTLTVLAEGGNGSYSYQWPASNVNVPSLNNIPAGAYAVKVIDQKGCNTTTSFTLDNPVKFAFDIEDKTICIGQKYSITSIVENGTYEWSSPNGFQSNQRQVTLTQPGTYTLKVINASGCTAEDNFLLQTSADLLHADLLMVTEAFLSDTVVVVDLSWPLPETTTWMFPPQANVVEENAALGYAFIHFTDVGQYEVGIRVTLADCVDSYNQMITIKEGANPHTGGRENKVNLIQYFEIYPNPNKGTFEIITELSEVQTARLMIINTEGNKILLNTQSEGQSTYHWNISLPEMNQGTYFIVLKAGKETKAVRMLKL